jgi:hypothetical protein
VLDHAIGNINQINNFKIFLDKLYKHYHQNELHAISKELQIEVSKIGRVLGQRWAACSFRSAKAVWQVYPVRYEHFTYNKNSGMVNRLQNKSFLKDLALMLDVLQEIYILSEALQSRAQNIVTAEKLLKRTISSFEQLKECPAYYEKQVQVVIETVSFSHINFVQNTVYGSLLRDKLIQKITLNMQDNVLNTEHVFKKNIKIINLYCQTAPKAAYMNYLIFWSLAAGTWKIYCLMEGWRRKITCP